MSKIAGVIRRLIAAQKGLTPLELLLGLAAVAVIFPLTVSNVMDITDNSEAKNDEIEVLQAIESAAECLGEDIKGAKEVDLVDGAAAVDRLTLTGVDGKETTAEGHRIVYGLSGSALLRSVDGVANTATEHIGSIIFSRSGEVVKVKVVLSVTGDSSVAEELTYLFFLS